MPVTQTRYSTLSDICRKQDFDIPVPNALIPNAAWADATARLLSSREPIETADALVGLVGLAVQHDGTCLLVFHHDAPPDIVHHTLEPKGAEHYLDRYLAGPYLLDPLYLLALRESKPSACRFRDETPDRFRSSEYYRRYVEQTHLIDEIDYLLDTGQATTLALVVGRRRKMFARAEFERLQSMTPVVLAALKAIGEQWSTNRSRDKNDERLHRQLTRCFEHFGDRLLTEREQQISQLLLRGHSTKSVARELGIAPGTVMVHKRNLFAKLGISSQFELFSRFIDDLPGA